MRHLKIVGLLAAAAALMMSVGAGEASATTIDGPNGELVAGAEIAASLSANGEGKVTTVLETLEGTPLDTCTGSMLRWVINREGGTGKAVEGAILDEVAGGETIVTGLTWTGCTRETKSRKPGELEITNIAGTSNGTIKGKNIEWTVNTIFGSCNYGTGASLDLGTLIAGKPAVYEINAKVTRISGAVGCPAEARWTATYTVTNRESLTVTP